MIISEQRRQRQSHLIIHQAMGYGPEAKYLLVNMSEGPAHVQCVRIRAVTQDGTVEYPLSSHREDSARHQPQQLRRRMRQGPLKRGEFLELGTARELVGHVLTAVDRPEGEAAGVKELVIQVAAIYGAITQPVGARRRFNLRFGKDGAFELRPDTVHTEQLTSRWQRRVASRWLKRCLED